MKYATAWIIKQNKTHRLFTGCFQSLLESRRKQGHSSYGVPLTGIDHKRVGLQQRNH